ncbi:NUDIX domain-containing protein [Devosia sp. ZB163]|uniref:NUDIX hydrolase n=1 Tax=Devosia sp. ZB163 TaxID=3025938 RepID=UPI00235EA750|nr:NUDIX domain-containing protein [Devosia sp. ZB163]MDC9825083.1 NUDIX domain-containing protein [Devosia sp. ZB163]
MTTPPTIDRRMISFPDGDRLFTCRVGAIVRRNGHVLVHRVVGDDWVVLPGGRLELGEASDVAVVREIGEELGVAAEVGPLHFLLEGFYRDRGRTVHELGFYYEVSLPDAFPFRVGEVCHRIEDGGVMLEFLWVPSDEAGLNEANLYPGILRDRLAEPPATTTHLIVSEL